MTSPEPQFTVSQFVAVCNQTLDYAYPSVTIIGEVSSFKINQNKWVFFDLKDQTSSLACFMPLYKLQQPLEDGMKIIVRARPSLTKWGKFSLVIEKISPVGEGSIKKAFELLKQKLTKEGLFAAARKRPLPDNLTKIGVISSTGAAGYADFCKIVNARWGGLDIQTCHTQVQGLDAPAQIIKALTYLNEQAEVQLIAILRGGGSADDLACFNDEQLVRAIAVSKIPVITGIGHEVDETLADLAADLRGSTPSNVAELITRDKTAELAHVKQQIRSARSRVAQALIIAYDSVQNYKSSLRHGFQTKFDLEKSHLSTQISRLSGTMSQHLLALERQTRDDLRQIKNALYPQINQTYQHLQSTKNELRRALSPQLDRAGQHLQSAESDLRRAVQTRLQAASDHLSAQQKILARLDPDLVLKQGYSIVTGKLAPGKIVKITTLTQTAEAQIKSIKERN